MSDQGEADELDERTSLAWTRTGLALLLAAVVVARLTVARLGPVSVVVAALGLVVSGWILISSRQRFRAAHLALRQGSHRPDARLPAVLAGFIVAISLAELVALLR